MSDHTLQLLQRHRSAGIILDTNILLLHFVGLLDPQLIPRFKRTDIFTVEDFHVLRTLLAFTPKIITTPNIMTEVSNLLGQLTGRQRDRCFAIFVKGIGLLEETYLTSASLAVMGEFQRFGITDAGMTHLARQHLIITEDFRLSNFLAKAHIDVLNFNHIRTLNWK